MHQQQLTVLAQQQSLLMAAAAAGAIKIPAGVQQVPNNANLPNQSLHSFYSQFPGMMMPAAINNEQEKYMQVKWFCHELHFARNSIYWLIITLWLSLLFD